MRSPAVAITGIGALTALGPDVDALVTGLLEGRVGIGPLTAFPYAGRAQIAAQAPTPEIPEGVALAARDRRRLSRADRFALAVALEACTAAGLDQRLRTEAALAVGATTGGMRETEEAYARRRVGRDTRLRVSRFLGTSLGGAGAAISQGLGFHGPRVTLATACSSSALAIVSGARAIRAGRARVALAIGTDQLCRLTYSGFDALQALDVVPCRPFAADRRGLSLGEGAAALVLEDAEHARSRGAAIRGYVLGYGVTADAHHLTAPHPEGTGARRALSEALAMAGVAPGAVDYVNAHGTATPQNDRVEVGVLRSVLGPRLDRIPISSTKSQVGHTLGAAGAVEAVVTLCALERGFLPPTIGGGPLDPAFAGLDVVPAPGRRASLALAVSSSYGFGGHNVTLVLGREEAM